VGAIGYSSEDGWVLGSYTHGIFANTRVRRLILENLARRSGRTLRFEDETFSQEGEFDKLADLARANLDMDAIRTMMTK
jgi:adenosylcobyric acid synthase